MSSLTEQQRELLADLRDHQELMDSASELMTKISALLASYNNVTEVINQHNVNAEAHPELLKEIEELKKNESGAESVAAHNTSDKAHADIRALITALQNANSKINSDLIDNITKHNESLEAHADLRERLNALTNMITTMNLNTLTGEITQDLADLRTQLETLTTDYRSGGTDISDRIEKNEFVAEELRSQLDVTNNHVTLIARREAQSVNILDQLRVRQAALRYESYLDCVTADSLLVNEIVCTLGLYIKKNTEVSFNIHADVKEGVEDPILTLTPLTGNFTLSKTEEIANGEPLTITVDPTTPNESILAFRCDFNFGGESVYTSDSTEGLYANRTISRVFTVMTSKLLNNNFISLDGLPAASEPNRTFEVTIVNLNDLKDGTYTYDLAVNSEFVTIEPNKELQEGDTVTVTISAEQPREEVIEFTLAIHSEVQDSAEVFFDLHINALPTLDNATNTFPTRPIPDKTYQVNFAGIYSAQGNTPTYELIGVPDYLIFDKTSDILSGENIQLKVAANAVRGTEGSFIVRSTDENGIVLDQTIEFMINVRPEAESIITTLNKPFYNGGTSATFTISGGNSGDPDTRYVIDVGDSICAFSKTNNIIAGEEITIFFPKVAADSSRSFKIYALDRRDELSETPKSVQITVAALFYIATPTIVYPSVGGTVDREFTLRATEFKTLPNL